MDWIGSLGLLLRVMVLARHMNISLSRCVSAVVLLTKLLRADT